MKRFMEKAHEVRSGKDLLTKQSEIRRNKKGKVTPSDMQRVGARVSESVDFKISVFVHLKILIKLFWGIAQF